MWVLAVAPRLALADEYDDVLARARDQAASGRHADAARELDAARRRYPQDFTLTIEAAYQYFLAERYEQAEAAYRRAIDLSEGAFVARSGLAWTWLRQNRHAEAHSLFATLTAEAPTDATVRLGFDLSKPLERKTLELFSTASSTAHAYPSHPYKSWALGGSVGATVRVRERWLAGGTFRYTRFAFDADPTPPNTATSSFGQSEGYLLAGYASPKAGMAAQYAYIADGSGYSGRTHIVGGSARFSPWGDITLSGTFAGYADMDVGRLDLSWRMPLPRSFWARPGIWVQRAGTENLATASLMAGIDRQTWGAWIGGKYGDEVRPAYLDVPYALNIPEKVTYGASAGGRLSLGAHLNLLLAFEAHGLKRTDTLSPTRSLALFTTFGVGLTL